MGRLIDFFKTTAFGGLFVEYFNYSTKPSSKLKVEAILCW
jgi:hypothetical protein